MGSLSQITSDQENESIWKILAIELDHQILALKYVLYVTWAGGICLICMHEPEGAQFMHEPEGVQRPRASVDISGKFQLHMLHMVCNTSGNLKNLPNLPFTVLHLYITTGAVNGYGFVF